MKGRQTALAFALLLGLAFATAGCKSHTYQLRLAPEDGVAPVRMPARPDLQVAVVFREPDFHTRYTSRADDGHRFGFEDVHKYYAQLFKTMFGQKFGRVDFALGTRPEGYDVYVQPTLRMRVTGEEEKVCSAQVTITVTDVKGGKRYQRTAEGEYAFRQLELADEACKTALVLASTGPLSLTMNELVANLTTRPPR